MKTKNQPAGKTNPLVGQAKMIVGQASPSEPVGQASRLSDERQPKPVGHPEPVGQASYQGSVRGFM